jgi:hypothetical protein
MRLYPAVAKPGPRLVPKGGAVVCGEYLPENVRSLITSPLFLKLT